MADTLIWAGVVLVLGTTLIALLAPPARRALSSWAGTYVATSAERDAAVQETLASVAERRHKLAISAALIDEETKTERARLEAETMQYQTDLRAASESLDAAITARQKVIAARAEAEAALAPEAARAALQPADGPWLAEAYTAYCVNYQYADPLPFGRWIQGYERRRAGA